MFFLVFLFLVGTGEGATNGGVHSPMTNLSSSLSISALVPVKLFKM